MRFRKPDFSQPPSLEVDNTRSKNNCDHTPITEKLISSTSPVAIVGDLEAQVCVGERLRKIGRESSKNFCGKTQYLFSTVPIRVSKAL